jgi:hypothetical protein
MEIALYVRRSLKRTVSHDESETGCSGDVKIVSPAPARSGARESREKQEKGGATPDLNAVWVILMISQVDELRIRQHSDQKTGEGKK